MDTIGESLNNVSVKDIVNRARNYQKRFTNDQEKSLKGFGGVLVPNAFQIPNEIIDDGWLQELNGSELKILLFIIRKTFGFNKISGDRIPMSQIIEATGLTRRATLSAVRVLEECQLIKVIRSTSDDGTKSINFYRLVVREDYSKKE